MVAEIERCHQLGIGDAVLHPGFSGDDGTAAGIVRLTESLQKILDATADKNVRILLETMAGQGSVVGAELRHFADMLEGMAWHQRIGICVDTCHVFAAGYDIKSGDGYEPADRADRQDCRLRTHRLLAP